MRIAYVLGGMAAVAALLAGCGGGGADGAAGSPAAATRDVPAEKPPRVPCPLPSKQVRVTLDGHVSPANVGVVMAARKGYFGDAGLHVRVLTPGSPELPASYVAAGADDVGLTQQPQAVFTKALGEPIVAIGSVIPEPTEAMIWLRGSGIHSVADLEGKPIATVGIPFQQGFLEQALASAGLTADDVEVLPGGYEVVPTLLRGEVDAIFGGSPNLEGKALEARGVEPVATPVRELGIPAYDELMVIARSECVAKTPAMYRRFMAAVRRGTKAAVRNPGAAAAVIGESIEGDQEAGHDEIESQLQATLPLLSESGRTDLAQASDLVTWMDEAGMIERKPPVATLFTNEYLAP
jgi:putative hydroxymethylpyrimidine transport system substrate-binding protein